MGGSFAKLLLQFQFHDGSIKGESIEFYLGLVDKFQFHDGSIKGESLIIDTGGKLHFNSTMVRLKDKGEF